MHAYNDLHAVRPYIGLQSYSYRYSNICSYIYL